MSIFSFLSRKKEKTAIMDDWEDHDKQVNEQIRREIINVAERHEGEKHYLALRAFMFFKAKPLSYALNNRQLLYYFFKEVGLNVGDIDNFGNIIRKELMERMDIADDLLSSRICYMFESDEEMNTPCAFGVGDFLCSENE